MVKSPLFYFKEINMSWYVDIQYGNVKKNGLVLLSTCSVWHFLQLLNGKPFSSLIKPKNPIIEWVKCIPYHLSLRLSLYIYIYFSHSLSLFSMSSLSRIYCHLLCVWNDYKLLHQYIIVFYPKIQMYLNLILYSHF